MGLLESAWGLGAVVDCAPHSVTPTAQDSPPRRELFFLFVLLWKKNQVGGMVRVAGALPSEVAGWLAVATVWHGTYCG